MRWVKLGWEGGSAVVGGGVGQPDVALRFVDERGASLAVVIFEAKHIGDQYVGQRQEQVAAARREWPSASIVHVAIGGTHARPLGSRGDGCSFEVSWRALRTVLARTREPEAHIEAVLRDISSALDRWGYGPRTRFATLVRAHRSLSDINVDALLEWHPGLLPSAGPLAGLRIAGPSLATPAAALMAWRPT